MDMRTMQPRGRGGRYDTHVLAIRVLKKVIELFLRKRRRC